jgi:hypothetical protein
LLVRSKMKKNEENSTYKDMILSTKGHCHIQHVTNIYK